MPIIAKNEGGSGFDPVPAGVYAARCYSMVHVGTIEGDFEGQKKIRNIVRISWELPTEKKVFREENGEQPFVVSKDFTLSMHEKSALRKFLESWRGKGFSDEEAKAFDVSKLIGVACMISIIHKTKDGKTYAEISSLTNVPKGMDVPKQINPSFEFNYSEPFDKVKFESLPEWLRKKMMMSDEYKQITQAAPVLTLDQEKEIAAAATEGEQLLDAMEKSVEDELPF